MKNYHKYCRGKAYQQFRSRLLEKRGYHCHRCRRPTAHLELHHDPELYRCRTDDELRAATFEAARITILCRSCHIAESSRAYEERKRKRQETATPGRGAWEDEVAKRIKEVQTHDQERTVATSYL